MIVLCDLEKPPPAMKASLNEVMTMDQGESPEVRRSVMSNTHLQSNKTLSIGLIEGNKSKTESDPPSVNTNVQKLLPDATPNFANKKKKKKAKKLQALNIELKMPETAIA